VPSTPTAGSARGPEGEAQAGVVGGGSDPGLGSGQGLGDRAGTFDVAGGWRYEE
jgi:hypothetical protein